MKRLYLILCMVLLALPAYAADVAQNAVADGSGTVAGTDYLNGYSGTTSQRYTINSILALKTQASLHIDDILTALGISSEATNFGTFTGSTIADNQTAKAAIQALETAVETKVTSGGALGTGYIPKATSTTAIGNSALDDGITAANTLTYSGSGGVVAPKLTVSKSAGVAGDVGLYEANSTDTDAAGFRGPASLTANTSYRGQFPNARATSDKMVLAWTNSGETGTGTPTDPYVQAMSFIDLDNYLALDGGTLTDGSAHVHLTAAQMSDPRCHVSNYGQTTADVNIGLPTAAANLSCFFEVDTAQSNHWGVLADTNDNITIIGADGTVGSAGTDGAAAVMTAAQVGQSFACWTARTGASAYDWRCKAIAIGTSTFVAHAAW